MSSCPYYNQIAPDEDWGADYNGDDGNDHDYDSHYNDLDWNRH